MAIIIPSKNIYEISNPKIIDNAIDKISVNKTIVKPDNDYKVSVFNEDYQIEAKISEDNTQTEYSDAYALNQGGGTQRNVRGACGLRYKIEYFKIPTILIPKVKNNKVINKIYSGVDDDGNDEIKISIKATQQLYTGGTSYQPSSNRFYFDDESLTLKEEKDLFGNLADIEIENDVTSDVNSMSVTQPYSLKSTHSLTNNKNELKISSYLYVNSNNNWQPAIIELDVNKSKNVGNGSVDISEEIIDGVEYYKLTSIKFFVGADVYMASCLFESTGNISSIEGYIRATATRCVIKPEQISITVYGNTIGISLNEANKSYGDGNKPYSIDGNELLQDSGKVGDNNLPEYLASNILQQYRTGKETATLLCDINDYYDDSGVKRISTSDATLNKMTFDIYDEVVPMVRNSQGVDAPMSLTRNGVPKTFNVLGTRIFYDGAVWQELTLQENTQIVVEDDTARLSYSLSSDGTYYWCDGIGDVKSKNIVIESSIDGIPVTKIADNAFMDNDQIENVTIPDTITYIGINAFYNCSKLSKIVLPKNVTSIQNYTFYGCTNLASATIPNNLTSIGSASFEGCSNLKTITLPNSITTVGESAFSGCSSMITITIGNGVNNIGANAFLDCSSLSTVNISDLYYWCLITFANANANPLTYGKLYINNQYSAIIKIPQQITTIRDYAFYGVKSNGVIIHTSVANIGNYAFSNSYITHIYYEGNETQWSAINKATTWGSKKVYFYSEEMPEASGYWHYVNGVPTVWTEIIVPDYDITISGSTCYINDVRDKTSSSLVIPSTIADKMVVGIYGINSGGAKSIEIPSSVTYIEPNCFAGCPNVEVITIGTGITSDIEYLFFEGCENLRSIVISANNPTYTSVDGVVLSKDRQTIICYPKDKPDTQYNIPNYVKNIGEGAFYGCTEIREIFMPPYVTTIGRGAFYNCIGLEKINISQNVTTIPEYAFAECQGLLEVTLTTGTSLIKEYAFDGCYSLVTVYYNNPAQWGISTEIESWGNEYLMNAQVQRG